MRKIWPWGIAAAVFIADRVTKLLAPRIPENGQVLIPGIIGPIIGSEVLKNAELHTNDDGTTSFIPNVNIFLAAAVVAVLVFVTLIPILKMKKGEKSRES